MARLSALFRVCVLLLLLNAPVVSLGWLLANARGAIAAAVAVCLAILVWSMSLDRWVLRVHRARLDDSELAGSLRRALVSKGMSPRGLPPIYRFDDASPNALVVRSLTRTSILVSQGLVGSLTEDELRELLVVCLNACRKPGLGARSLCATLAAALLRLAPSGWTRLLLTSRSAPLGFARLSPVTFIAFVALFPWVKLLLWLGGRAELYVLNPGNEFIDDAARKVRLLSNEWPVPGAPGLDGLYFVKPWTTLSLLSLT